MIYCPICGSTNIVLKVWDTCLDCGCTFKILNRGNYKPKIPIHYTKKEKDALQWKPYKSQIMSIKESIKKHKLDKRKT